MASGWVSGRWVRNRSFQSSRREVRKPVCAAERDSALRENKTALWELEVGKTVTTFGDQERLPGKGDVGMEL